LTCNKSHFSLQKGVVKQGAFIPPKSKALSVFDINSLTIDQIVNGPKKVFDKLSGKNAIAYAETSGKTFTTIDLSINYNNFPKRHADIIGWPSEKELQKEKALEIVSNSILRKFNT
jgi:hypothetical protein